ncbi:4-hydroxy-tetrahydrodipicolinate reductase [Catalinimonas alkaloidigena]|uniref:4-hydroxy-tetrahydrodipicolinate reductase n=1 Tax=Catalinimonas alkaloidigena TaxID=1075417 RepID=UPI002404DD35|nr:4-hydroxy-tetrahydrodipicolinate reductase [Catalinimonas alkaloidigena]MDF9796729.1 4-hydroxy-tetrahydrodipicolinate reductase [Catalinimonas alkaloidigena]
MNILILGYGKMGKTIEKIAINRGHQIIEKVDVDHRDDILSQLSPQNIDVAIEFTQAEAAPTNIRYCLKNNIPVVSGTTGWLKEKPAIEDYCIEQNGTFFYASNFSIGVNIFFKLNEFLAKMMNAYPDYQPSMVEVHHTQKKDAPSGTAITLAEGMLKELSQINDWYLKGEYENLPEQNLPITSKREGDVPGTHVVTYHSEIDDIEIKHTAHGREGFALGAVLVAEWLQNKKGILSMNDFIKF